MQANKIAILVIVAWGAFSRADEPRTFVRPVLLTGESPLFLESIQPNLDLSEVGLVFLGSRSSEPNVTAMFLWDGLSFHEVARAGDGEFLESITAVAVNDFGKLAATVYLPGRLRPSVMMYDDQGWTEVFDGDAMGLAPAAPSVNAVGDIAFTARGDASVAVYMVHNGEAEVFVDRDAAGLADLADSVTVNDLGHVYFHALEQNGTSAAYRADAPGNVELVRTLECAYDVCEPAANVLDDYVVMHFDAADPFAANGVFRVRADGEQERLASGFDGLTALDTRVETNNRREAVFLGTAAVGSVYRADEATLRKLVEIGDAFEQTVFTSLLSPQTDGRSRVCFHAELADGRSGLFLVGSVGDGEADGDFDLADFRGFSNCFSGDLGEPEYEAPSDSCRLAFDADDDGDVDLADHAASYATLPGPCTGEPLIRAHPASLAIAEGGQAAFSVVAESSRQLVYQWRFNGADLPGETGAILTIVNATQDQRGRYSVVVNDGCASVITGANLRVGPGDDYRWADDLNDWGNAASWDPPGVPMLPQDRVRIDNGGRVVVDNDYDVDRVNGSRGSLGFNYRFHELLAADITLGLEGEPFTLETQFGGDLTGPVSVGATSEIRITGETLQHLEGPLTLHDGATLTATGAGAAFVSSPDGLRVLDEGAASGRLDALAGGSLTLDGWVYVDGTMLISDGTLITTGAGPFFLGQNTSAMLTVEGPTTLFDAGHHLWMGGPNSGLSRFELRDGAHLRQSSGMAIGDQNGGPGEFIVDAASMDVLQSDLITLGSVYGLSTWTVRNAATVNIRQQAVRLGGNEGADLSIQNAGTRFEVHGSAEFYVGDQPWHSAVVEVSDGAAFDADDTIDIRVGVYGRGSMEIMGEGSSMSVGQDLLIGRYEASYGAVRTTAGAEHSTAHDVFVGFLGYGAFMLEGEGTRANIGNALYVGYGLTSSGEALVSDGASLDSNLVEIRAAGALTMADASLTVNTDLINAGMVGIERSTVTLGRRLLGNGGQIWTDGAAVDLRELHLEAAASMDDRGTASTWHITRLFKNASTQRTSWKTLETTLQFDGGNGRTEPFEAAGEDRGAFSRGYVDNFAFGAVRVGPTRILLRLEDLHDSSPGAEAVYVNTLVLDAGTTLNLNGLNLYYRTLIDNGATIVPNGGRMEQVPECNGDPELDCNHNGVPDECDINEGTSSDSNGDGIPDECGDCNNNGVPDAEDIANGTSRDCNGNGLPDECDLAEGRSDDCNANAVPDECDVATYRPTQLYWVSTGTSVVQRANLDGTKLEDAVTGYSQLYYTLADVDGGWIYFTRGHPDTAIYRTDLGGFADETVIVNAGRPRGMAVDGLGHLYWCDEAGRIWRADLATREPEMLISGLGTPAGLALDVSGGKMYFTDLSAPRVRRANLDGTGLENLGDSQSNLHAPISLDLIARKVYWINDNGSLGAIRRMNLDGTGEERVADVGKTAQGLVVLPEEGKIYWCDRSDNNLQRCNLDGSGAEVVLADGLSQPINLVPGAAVGAPDCNDNQIPDECDILEGTSTDLNGSGLPDECEDCNHNGIPDDLDVSNGTSPDCNGNGVPDECDVLDGTSRDCNGNLIPDECETDCNDNGVPDDCDVNGGGSTDCNGNGVPDECDADCNFNGVPDRCDVENATSPDCNGNAYPDECEADCNFNAVADECDIRDGASEDGNGNGVPDECESPLPQDLVFAITLVEPDARELPFINDAGHIVVQTEETIDLRAHGRSIQRVNRGDFVNSSWDPTSVRLGAAGEVFVLGRRDGNRSWELLRAAPNQNAEDLQEFTAIADMSGQPFEFINITGTPGAGGRVIFTAEGPNLEGAFVGDGSGDIHTLDGFREPFPASLFSSSIPTGPVLTLSDLSVHTRSLSNGTQVVVGIVGDPPPDPDYGDYIFFNIQQVTNYYTRRLAANDRHHVAFVSVFDPKDLVFSDGVSQRVLGTEAYDCDVTLNNNDEALYLRQQGGAGGWGKELRLTDGASQITLVKQSDVLDGLTVLGVRISSQAMNNAREAVFAVLAENGQGQRSTRVYRARPVYP